MGGPNATHTFGICMKQILTASNIDLSDILEPPSYQTTKDGVESCASMEELDRCIYLSATFHGNSGQVI